MDTASTTPTTDTSITPTSDAPTPAVVVPATTASKTGWGGLIGIILIVGLIITAAFYSWGERLSTQAPIEATSE